MEIVYSRRALYQSRIESVFIYCIMSVLYDDDYNHDTQLVMNGLIGIV